MMSLRHILEDTFSNSDQLVPTLASDKGQSRPSREVRIRPALPGQHSEHLEIILLAAITQINGSPPT